MKKTDHLDTKEKIFLVQIIGKETIEKQKG